MRRAAVSFTSNIAEGFNRKYIKEKIQFYTTAFASLTELQNQLLIARDIPYIAKQDFSELADRTIELAKMTNGLIRSTKLRLSSTLASDF